ncbi:hypothetical protein MLD38_000224 [Melastoma candidum]|uniref:Uncharacterized protein n=1 Tax=Melastoma candidum TaxID=119954 RepID=A0ACB9S8R8_9MYRT|nr:hypothetical protein MLD38_000224 [Melastoma candidum]
MGILPVALVPPPVALPWIQRNISSSDTVATSWVVLKHSTCGSTSTTVATVATSASTSTPSQAAAANAASEKDKRQAHKRKFQELPVEAKEPTASNQVFSDFCGANYQILGTFGWYRVTFWRVYLERGRADSKFFCGKGPVNCETSPTLSPPKDTLVKLMEYGEEDDEDVDEDGKESLVCKSDAKMTPKPFWEV